MASILRIVFRGLGHCGGSINKKRGWLAVMVVVVEVPVMVVMEIAVVMMEYIATKVVGEW